MTTRAASTRWTCWKARTAGSTSATTCSTSARSWAAAARAADAARRQRIHPRMGTRLQDAGDARALCAGRGSRTKYWEDAKAVGRFEGDASIRSTGGPSTRTPRSTTCGADDAFWGARLVARFSDDGHSRDRRQGPLQRTGRRGPHRHHADQAPRQGRADVAHRRQPARRAATGCRRHADVRKRSRVGWRGVTAVTLCPVVVARSTTRRARPRDPWKRQPASGGQPPRLPFSMALSSSPWPSERPMRITPCGRCRLRLRSGGWQTGGKRWGSNGRFHPANSADSRLKTAFSRLYCWLRNRACHLLRPRQVEATSAEGE